MPTPEVELRETPEPHCLVCPSGEVAPCGPRPRTTAMPARAFEVTRGASPDVRRGPG